MRNLQYILCLVLSALVLAGCVKEDYDIPARTLPPAPDKAVRYVNETFDEAAKVDGQMLLLPTGWANVAVEGIRVFQTGALARKDGDLKPVVERGVMGSGYLSADTVNDFWLIMPPLDVSDSARMLSFEVGVTYDNASTKFTVMYSDTYTGDTARIAPSEWQSLGELSHSVTQSGAVDMKPFKDISLYGKGGSRKVVYVAFRYYSKVTLSAIAAGNASRANYYLDNVQYR